MRALLSTQLFAALPLQADALRLAREAGFPSLELFGSARHVDLFHPAERRRIQHLLSSTGTRAPWLHLHADLLDSLRDDNLLAALPDALAELGVEVVTAALLDWPLPSGGQSLDLDELRIRTAEVGTRLVIEADRLDRKAFSRSTTGPMRWLGELCWDLASLSGSAPLSMEEIESMLDGTTRGRMAALRASHGSRDRREPPGPREAVIVEETMRSHGPEVVIYDVADELGMASLSYYREILEQIRTFHEGGMLPPRDEGGGVFWASMAPG